MNGGDFDWTFDETDDTNYSVDTALKAAVVNYESSVLAIGGYDGGVTPPVVTEPETEETTEATTQEPTTESTTQEPTTQPETEPTTQPATEPETTAPAEETAGSQVHNFTEDGKTSSFFTINGNLSSSKGTVSYNGLTLTTCLKIESSTSVQFTTDKESELVLVFNKDNSSNIKVDGTVYTLTDGILTLDLAAGSHTITKGDSINVYAIIAE